jgi:Sec-independent protein translocase protein TatA
MLNGQIVGTVSSTAAMLIVLAVAVLLFGLRKITRRL